MNYNELLVVLQVRWSVTGQVTIDSLVRGISVRRMGGGDVSRVYRAVPFKLDHGYT